MTRSAPRTFALNDSADRAPRHSVQRLDTPIKALLSFWYHEGNWAGSAINTPRVTNINRCPLDTQLSNTYEVLHLHYRIQLRNRSARPADVRLPDGSAGQEAGALQERPHW